MKTFSVTASYEATFTVDIEAETATEAEYILMDTINDYDIPKDANIKSRDYFIIDSRGKNAWHTGITSVRYVFHGNDSMG